MFQIGDYVVLARPRIDIAEAEGAIGIITAMIDYSDDASDVRLDIRWLTAKRSGCFRHMYLDQFDKSLPPPGILLPQAADYYEAITQ